MRRLPISTLRPAVSMPVTDPRITWVFACVARMPRIGAAMSAGDKAAVATWYKSGWNKWWLRRSITVTSAATLPSRFAADKPPKPAPMMTMRGRETPAEGPRAGLCRAARQRDPWYRCSDQACAYIRRAYDTINCHELRNASNATTSRAAEFRCQSAADRVFDAQNSAAGRPDQSHSTY